MVLPPTGTCRVHGLAVWGHCTGRRLLTRGLKDCDGAVPQQAALAAPQLGAEATQAFGRHGLAGVVSVCACCCRIGGRPLLLAPRWRGGASRLAQLELHIKGAAGANWRAEPERA